MEKLREKVKCKKRKGRIGALGYPLEEAGARKGWRREG